ncbi:alpha/beta family hydrolase [Thalassotalea fusca]
MSNIEDPSIILNEVSDPKALILFAHGAGADKSSDFMDTVTNKLNNRQCSVMRFNFPYMDKRLLDNKRRPPDRMPKLVDCFELVLKKAHAYKLPIILMGKSMGSRVAAIIAEKERPSVVGVVALGYPFHPQKKPDSLRLDPLISIKTPMLIIQGSRDPLGNESEVNSYGLPPHCKSVFLEDGDHDLKPRVKSGYTHEQHLDTAINSIMDFVNALQ